MVQTLLEMNPFKPGDCVITKEYGDRVVVGIKDDVVEVDVNFLPEPVEYKVGSTLTLPMGVKAEAVKVTDEYIIFDVPNHNPIKLLIKDIKLFQTLEQ